MPVDKIRHMQEGTNPHFLFLSGLNIHRLFLNNKAEKSTRVEGGTKKKTLLGARHSFNQAKVI